MVDQYYTGAPEDEEATHLGNVDRNHEECEKRISELKNLLENMQEKYKTELNSVKSECDVRLSECICRICKKNNLLTGDEQRSKQTGITLEQYYTEKIKELGNKYSSSSLSKDLELTVYQIKEEVRKDYECEIDKIREEIVMKELKRKDDEVNLIKSQLTEAHKLEVENLWRMYDELANKEAENSAIRVKNEVILSQELEEKGKLIEQLKNDKKELLKKQQTLIEQRQKENEQLKSDLIKAHKKETENIKQAFQIEMTTRIETILEEKAEIEEKLKWQIAKLHQDINTTSSEKEDWQDHKKQEVQQLTENVRKEIFRALELQIKEMVASGDEGEDRSQWPPELVALERQFTSKYQRQLAQLVEEHALELADVKAEYDAKLSDLVKEYSIKQAEETPLAMIYSEDQDIDNIIRERNNLRCLALTLQQAVQELARYLTTCEDELNKSIVSELVKLTSLQNGHEVNICTTEIDSSDSEVEQSLTQKKVHFAPDVSSIVTLMDEFLESSVDVSVHFRTELEACLERLRGEAAAVLGFSQRRCRTLPTTVEDRRLSSLTRQLIEEKKAKEEANSEVQELQDLLHKYEKELNSVKRELTETKDRMIKEKVTAETEFNEMQAERSIQKLCLLQDKARALLNEMGDCPPMWLGLIDELCVEGDSLIEEAWKARDELQMEVEAADKQLRSTRAFLEEQATEREQERDEFSKEIERLTGLLRERDRDWTSHKQFTTEVETLEQQVKETSEVLKETEEKKLKIEKELKAAVDKIWVLRDIISELEVQVSSRQKREVDLEHRLAELEAELDTQTRGQADMLNELEALRNCSENDALQQELSSLQDQLHKQSSPVIVRHIKSQLRGMAKALEKQIKELEAVNIHVSNASLSSPSEDVSIREQLEALRCSTPEDKLVCNGSPPTPLPVEEINQLNDKLLRYSRAAENLIKKLRDRDMEIVGLRAQSEELQTERDVLHSQTERQLMQLATLANKVEDLRLHNGREIQAKVAPLHQHILELEKNITSLTDQLKDSQRKLTKMKQKLDRSEALVTSQEAELNSMSDHQQEMVQKLNQDLVTMRAEKDQLQAVVMKYRAESNVNFPMLIEIMLAEKNADIDQLQQRVEELLAQQESSVPKNQNHQYKSRSYRVSFADDVTHSRLAEGEKARDAHYDVNSIKPIFSTPLSSIGEEGNRIVPRMIGEDISKIPEPGEISSGTSPNRAVQLESVLSTLKSELEQKTQRLLECEAKLEVMPVLEQELIKTKEELVETVKSITEDKHFYEEQLKTLSHTQQLLANRDAELKELRVDLAQKEENIVKTTADVKALQIIMEGLQQKLQEAKTFTENCENSSALNGQLQEMKVTNSKYKEECDTYKTTIVNMEEQVLKLNKDLETEQTKQKTLQETVDKLETDKQNIVSELIITKSKCKSLQEELEIVLSNAKQHRVKIESLNSDLEISLRENKKLSLNCQRLKKEMECLTKKQKIELQNILKKDSEEVFRLKEEIESLKSANSELRTVCEKLKQELNDFDNNVELFKELNSKDDKIQELQIDLKRLEEDNESLKNDKLITEQSLIMKISELKMLNDDLNKSIVSLGTESKESQESIHDREHKENLKRRYEALKRDYDRQRRAKRESEKKVIVLKEELTKEKCFSARLQNGAVEKRIPKLVITKVNTIDIRSDEVKLTNSLDNLADEVQKELNTSARLDQNLIAGLKSSDNEEVPRSDHMPPRVNYLTERLAEVETALHVEQVVVSELRARLNEERARYLEERTRTHELRQEVASLQTLNDQFEDKFKNIAYQLEQQLQEVKEMRQNMGPSDTSLKEKEMKRLLEDNQRKVDELLQERVFNKNQLLYLREELAKLSAESDTRLETYSRGHGHGDDYKGTAVNNLQKALDCRIHALDQEQRKSAALQKMLDQANQNIDKQIQQLVEATTQVNDLQSKVNDVKRQLSDEVKLRKSLEAKVKCMEAAERSRQSRRNAREEKIKQVLTQTEKEKKELERECLNLQLRLKHVHLQLTAHTTESPLSLRLTEANMAVERLVGEKEDLNSANALLREAEQELQRRVREQDKIINDLKSRIQALNIKVTDGGVGNLNAMFAAERAAWLKEKETLKLALAHPHPVNNTDSFNSYSNTVHILQQYLRAESHRKSLVWQKRYLMMDLHSYKEQEKQTVAALSRFHAPPYPPPPSPERKFRVAVCVVRAVARMQFIVERHKRANENTCWLLQRALNNRKIFPRRADYVPELQTLWRKIDGASSSSSLQPGSLSQYMDHFNTIQDRIKNNLASAS